MKICLFGIYNPDYSRNRVLISGLKQNNIEVVECRAGLKTGRFLKYWNLYKEYRKIEDQDFEYVIVAFPGHTVVWLARLLFGKKIIFDAFTSLYDSEVFDRKNVKKVSLKARYLWFLDKVACSLSYRVLLDTNEHIKYFVEKFGIDKNKFIRVFVGTDDSVFYPKYKKDINKFIVHFHGSNIPLQGVKYVLESAKLLEQYSDIQFNIVGSKIKKEYEDGKYKNVNFIENILYEELPAQIAQADVCLGIFGDTDKTQRVIPNKVYEYIACAKPVITADTPAVKELFTDNKYIVLTPAANSQTLSEKILLLKKDKNLSQKISQNSHELYVSQLKPKKITNDLLKELKEINIAIITPMFKQDYLTDTVLDGLVQLKKEGEKINFYISSKYKTRLPFKFLRLNKNKFLDFAKRADIILFMWGKGNTDFELVEKVGEWNKTIFIDGSELGGNRRLDNDINKQVLDGVYQANGKIDKEMLEKCALYLRREKPYVNDIKPFPFGIENSYIKYSEGVKKDIDFACIFGQEDFPPLRKEVRQELEKYCKKNNFTCVTEKTKSSKEFYDILARTKVGVSVSGGGYDTARFWEILGNNCILLTEKVDVFKDGDFKYGNVFEFEGLEGFRKKLKEVGGLLKNNYSEDKFYPEFKKVLEDHSSKARVKFILDEARGKGII